MFAVALPAQQPLNMHLSSHRFLTSDKQTIVHLDYQIPYRNLVFLAQKGGYFAEVELSFEIVQGDSVMLKHTITDNIGISDKSDAGSDKSYLNRVSFLIEGEKYDFRVKATDLNSKNEFLDYVSVPALPRDRVISDLELCSEVKPDSSSYLERFHRGKTLFRTQPSLIFDKNETAYLYLYFEVYTNAGQRQQSNLIVLSVQRDGEIVSDDYIDFNSQTETEGITLKVPLSELKPGKYTGNLEIQVGELAEEQEFEFFVTEPKIELVFLFPNPDDDYNLLKYFSGTRITADWKSMNTESKRKYISQVWRSWATANGLPVSDALDQLRERVEYANKNFSFFNPGWTTDMGRIHIRNGKPDEIDKDTTLDDTRYVRKDYQIWKYRGKTNAVYLFVDIQMNGNYKLVYVQNDDMESSNPDFLRYLGEDFDTSVLSN
jgi:GWxTD domain-containing protein